MQRVRDECTYRKPEDRREGMKLSSQRVRKQITRKCTLSYRDGCAFEICGHELDVQPVYATVRFSLVIFSCLGVDMSR